MSIDESHDGGFVISGYRTYANIATIYRVDHSGVADFKTYGDSLYIEKNSIRKTDDGGYMFMNYFLKHDPDELTRIYFSKLNSDLEVEWTNWLDDKYTSDITAHSYLPTELVPTLDGGFAFLYHNKGKYILVKTKSFR